MRKHFQIYSSVVVAGILFLVLLALSQANTTWAARGEQGTVGGPPTATPTLHATATSKPGKPGGPCDTCATATATALPKLPVTGGDGGNGASITLLPLLLLLGAGLAWQGLRLARR